jgi:hypothetical protein
MISFGPTIDKPHHRRSGQHREHGTSGNPRRNC